jgi:hypothetical protein
MARELATTIVGDLTEQAHFRGRGWFAREVLRVAFGFCVRSLISAPLRALCLAGLGFAVYAGAYAVLFVASGLPWYPWHRIHEPGFLVRLALVVAASNLVTGVLLGRRAVRGGVGAVAPLTAFWLAAWLISPFVTKLTLWPWLQFWLVLAFPFLYLLPLLLGAVIAQRRMTARIAAPFA